MKHNLRFNSSVLYIFIQNSDALSEVFLNGYLGLQAGGESGCAQI